MTANPVPPASSPTPAPPAAPLAAALALGVLAVALFGLTLPVTRLALGASTGAGGAAMSPWFLTFGRVVLAAGCSAAFLLLTRASWPQRGQWGPLAVAALGNAVLYPLSLALALQHVDAAHVAVVTALLPLATAVAAAWLAGAPGHRGGPRFWVCAALSCALVVAFSLARAQAGGGVFAVAAVDLIVVAGVAAASVGYVYGARVTRTLGAERVICWITLLTLPVSLPVALWTWPEQPLPATAWGAFVYVGAVSMWAAFFAWYRALDWGGPLRVSQLQALQPFFSIAFALPLLGESLDVATLAFAAAVVVTVGVGTRR